MILVGIAFALGIAVLAIVAARVPRDAPRRYGCPRCGR